MVMKEAEITDATQMDGEVGREWSGRGRWRRIGGAGAEELEMSERKRKMSM